MSNKTLTRGYITITIDESADCRIVIPALQVIHSQFGIKVVSAVGKRIVGSVVIGPGTVDPVHREIAPGVIRIGEHLGPGTVVDGNDIAL